MAEEVQLKGRKIQVKQGLAKDYKDELLDVGEFGLIIDSEELRIGVGGGKTIQVNGGGGESTGTTVVNNLTSTSTTSALSAYQGNILKQQLDTHINNRKVHESELNQYITDRDNNGYYTKVRFARTDDTTYLTSELSNPDLNGYYGTVTWKFYDELGNTVIETKVWTMTYDEDGNVTSKVIS